MTDGLKVSAAERAADARTFDEKAQGDMDKDDGKDKKPKGSGIHQNKVCLGVRPTFLDLDNDGVNDVVGKADDAAVDMKVQITGPLASQFDFGYLNAAGQVISGISGAQGGGFLSQFDGDILTFALERVSDGLVFDSNDFAAVTESNPVFNERIGQTVFRTKFFSFDLDGNTVADVDASVDTSFLTGTTSGFIRDSTPGPCGGPVGGTVQLLVGGSEASTSPAGGSAPSVPYATVAGGLAAAALAVAAGGGWYARRRWLR